MIFSEPKNGASIWAESSPATVRELYERQLETLSAASARRGQIAWAAYDAQVLTQNATNSLARRSRAYDERIAAVEAATGVRLDNPEKLQRMPDRDELTGMMAGETLPGVRRRRFQERLQELARQFPDKADLIRANVSIEDDAKALGQKAERDLAALLADENNPFGSSVASFVGSALGYMRDPLQFSSLFIGGGAGTGASAGARVLSAVAINAAVNAGTEAALQVPAQMGRAEAGLESGLAEGAKNVGLAALLGGLFGGVIQGGAEGLAVLRKGAPGTPDAVVPVPVRDIEAVGEALADDAAAFGAPPAGIPADEATRMAREAVAGLEDRVPVRGAVQAPEAAPDLRALLREVASAERPQIGRIAEVQGRPTEFRAFDPRELKTDAAAYQYKGGGDEAGVTDRLAQVQKWDPLASGKVFVHERADGLFVADGHQRLGLARRLSEAGDDDIRLDGFLFREADGWTAADVRALAARKNMQEGSGTALDAARILRDRPELLDDSLPRTGPMMRRAISLGRLSDDAWGMTVNGMVPESHAALVSDLVENLALQGPILQLLKRAAPETDRLAAEIVEEALSSGYVAQTQYSLFGPVETNELLILHRARVRDEALTMLRADKKLFGTLADNAEVIEAAGNRLDAQGNAARAVSAEQMEELLRRMSRVKGPVSDVLTAQAVAVAAKTTKPKQAARAFIAEVRRALEDGGLQRLLAPPQPELKPQQVIEPGTPEAAASVEALAPEPTLADLEAAGQRSMWDMMPDGVDADGRARLTTPDVLEADAARDADIADLLSSCKD